MKTSNVLIIASICGAAGYAIGNALGNTVEEKQRYGRNGAIIGVSIALGGLIISSQQKNTVNYILKHKGRRVYDGITHKNRLDTRIFEHECSGKKFDKVISGPARSRTDARILEQKRILRYSPKYNVQYNGI